MNNILMAFLVTIMGFLGVIFYLLKSRGKLGSAIEIKDVYEKELAVLDDSEEQNKVYEQVKEIELKGSNGAGIIVKQYEGGIAQLGKKLDLDKSGINRSAPFLQQLPNVLLANEALSGKYMEVIVNGDLASVKEAADVFHPIVRGENGKIIEQAKLKDPKSLQGMAKFSMAFQLVSVLVAQKHLADIAQSLDQLKEGIDEIRAFQKNDRYSKIVGTIEYLCQIENAIRSGELDSSVRSNLEGVERELMQIQAHLKIDIEGLCGLIKNLEDKNPWGGSEKTFNALNDMQENLQDTLKAWSECVLTRAYACTLLSAFPGNRILIASRIEAINLSVNVMSDELLPKCSSEIRDRASKIDSIYSTSEDIRRQMKEVEKYIENNSFRFEDRSRKINMQLSKMDDLYADQLNTNGVRMVIGLNGSDIEEAFLLEPSR